MSSGPETFQLNLFRVLNLIAAMPRAEGSLMKKFLGLCFLVLLTTATLQIRLSHDSKKGYSYVISGPELEEVIEADKKVRQYLKSQTPKKAAGPAPSTPGTRPTPKP
jgi:hypothetical protein